MILDASDTVKVYFAIHVSLLDFPHFVELAAVIWFVRTVL